MRKEILVELGGVGLGLAVLSGCVPVSNQRIENAVGTAVAKALTPPTPGLTLGPRAESTATVTPKAEATNKPEVVTSTMELPKPAAWDHVPVVSLVQVSSIPAFPKTAAEAATLFGVDGSTRDPKRWELTPDGGWHLSEAQINDDTKDALNVNAKGYLMEGYYDTRPGRNPYAFVIVGIDGNVPLQGGTFWNEKRLDQATKLQGEMAIPKWKDDNGNVTNHPVEKIIPNSVVSNQKVEATQEVPIKYPDTADKAASFFGGKPEEWKLNPSGDWNFNSKEGAVVITLDGVTADGYNEDGPVVATGLNDKISVRLLGATIYNINLDKVRRLIDKVQANHPGEKVQVVGIVK